MCFKNVLQNIAYFVHYLVLVLAQRALRAIIASKMHSVPSFTENIAIVGEKFFKFVFW